MSGGGGFVENHIQKALSKTVILVQTAVPKAVVDRRCPPLPPDVDEIASLYQTRISQPVRCVH